MDNIEIEMNNVERERGSKEDNIEIEKDNVERERKIRNDEKEIYIKCIKCGNDIITYGEKSEAFITMHNEIGGDKYYHMECKKLD